MTIKLPILFSQYDLRWNLLLLGNNTDPKFNINNDGCLLTCLSTICKYFGIDTDPARLNEMLKNLKPVSGFSAGGGDYVWGSLTKVYMQVTEKLVNTPDLLTDAQMAEIKSAIDAGFPVAIQIDYNPGTSNIETHYVVIIAYDNADENNFTIYDPLGGTIHSLRDYLGAFRPSARNDINQYVIYSGPLQNTSSDVCLLPNTPENQATFENLVHGSTQWDTTVAKYIPGADPKHTDFGAIQDVVGGIQSSATAANNAKDKAISDLAVATQQITNDGEKLALEEAQRQADAKGFQAQIDALKPNADSIDKMAKLLNGQIGVLQDQVKQLTSDKHDLLIQIAQLKAPAKPNLFLQFLIWVKNVTKK